MSKFLSRILLKTWGWEVEGSKPALDRYILIMAPHTSRYDAIPLLTAGRVLDIPINWMVARDAVRGPLGPLVRQLGAITVDRSRSESLVNTMVAEFAKRESLVLAIAPMGVTRYSEHWRSGFYHIATQANVPFVFSYLDWGKKRLGIGPSYMPTGDVSADMDVIRAFYGDKTGKFPENKSKIYLKMEATNPTGG